MKTDTPAVAPSAPVANAPLAEKPEVSLIDRAKSDYGRIPLLPGVEKKRRITGQGETVLTLESFDWAKVPVEHLARCKAAVSIMRTLQAFETAQAAYSKAIAK